METSISIKKFWFADIASDGGIGTNWRSIAPGQREATVQFQGSDANVNSYKNVLGDTLESSMVKGDKTMNFQFADLTADIIAAFVGGDVTEDSVSTKYECPDNENQKIEKSIRFLTANDILVEIPRCSFDGYPSINDDDLHYYQMNSIVLKPSKEGTKTYTTYNLKETSANDILVFSLDAQTGPATIDTGAHTVTIEVATGTVITALEPVVGVSLGADVDPYSGEATDFTSDVTYTVEAADTTKQTWTVTVTVAA